MTTLPALSRRSLLTGGLALLATPSLGAPAPEDARPWIAYEARLRSRLGDAGGGRFDAGAARKVLALTNAVRAEAGASALAWHDELALAARAHASDLLHRDYFEHLSPETFDPSHRAWLLGRRTIGSPSENIAYRRGGAPASAADLMGVWRGSPQHWKNLLRPSHTHAAFGVVRAGDRTWIVGLYARPVVTLLHALPFRPTADELQRSFESIPAGLRAGIGLPQGADPRGVGAPQVLQLSAGRKLDARTYESIGGPIYLRPA